MEILLATANKQQLPWREIDGVTQPDKVDRIQ